MTDIAAHSEFRLVEPLSNRERDILALLAENLSDREIADRLVIGYTTVKWYNRQIFGKLGAENRKAAVQRARALGLFDSTAPTLTPNHNLPSHLTPFIGRSKELDDLSRWLGQSHPRLVTILAPGGMGTADERRAAYLPAAVGVSRRLHAGSGAGSHRRGCEYLICIGG